TSVRLGARYLTVIGRLRKGVSLREGQAEIAVLDARYQKENPGNHGDLGLTAHAGLLQQEIAAGFRLNLLVAWGAVICLLLIACANVANLFLSRATARRREISVRLAIGAGRGRIARQLLSESVLIAVCGAALGLPLAHWGVALLVSTIRQSSRAM